MLQRNLRKVVRMSDPYEEVPRDAPATLITVPHGGQGSSGATATKFDTAQAAFAAALNARSNDFALVQVAVEGSRIFEIEKIEEIYAYWQIPYGAR
jgi:hypothetical protein